ncbi:MAG: hypothetical protein J6K89_02805, partial [Oscillospiraceae bacterium]|nr:hypothetical protein [Oscillospiraceae bacterium]
PLGKRVFLSDAFLTEHDAHFVRDAGSACDARLRRVGGTQCITSHSVAASLLTYENLLLCIMLRPLGKRVFLSDAFLAEHDEHFVGDAGSACDARLRRVRGTQRITYHGEAVSLITFYL